MDADFTLCVCRRQSESRTERMQGRGGGKGNLCTAGSGRYLGSNGRGHGRTPFAYVVIIAWLAWPDKIRLAARTKEEGEA
jgi:hypothetical protein